MDSNKQRDFWRYQFLRIDSFQLALLSSYTLMGVLISKHEICPTRRWRLSTTFPKPISFLYVSTYTQAPLFKLSQIKIFNDAQVRLAKYHWACDWKVSLQNTLDNELENGVQI